MIAVDTNVLLRYVLADDASHSRAARRLIDEVCSPQSPAFVHDVALAEFVWVLGRRKPFDRAAIAASVRQLTDNTHLRFRDVGGLLAAIDGFEKGPANFAEYLIAAQASSLGAAPTFTFDKDAGKSPGFTLIQS
ncbi:MAG: PIN domain-containing protein [Bauldia sp.]|jgi:predicted nucleic-acid-binding protein